MPAENIRPFDQLCYLIGELTKAHTQIQQDMLRVFINDIKRFEEMTSNVQEQMQWRAYSVVGLSLLAGSLGIAGACIPATGTPASADSRLAANEGVSDALSSFAKAVGDKLKDNEFLSSTCKTVSQSFQQGFIPAANTWHESKTIGMEAKREWLRHCFNQANQEKGTAASQHSRINDLLLSIIQARKGQ